MYRAFWRLSGSRIDGGPIPFEALDRYATRYGIEDFEEFVELIQAMDSAYAEHRHRKA